MNERELMQYRSLLREIEEQEIKLEELRNQPVPRIIAGQVQSSKKEFPYTPTRLTLGMQDHKAIKAKRDCIIIKEQRIKEATELKVKIEQFIKDIKDSELRRIFEMRFIDGMKQDEIARRVCLDRSRISRKIKDYLEKRTQSTKTV